jgi:ribokinase
MHRKILVVGSSNTDMVIKTAAFPQPGETVLGGTFMMNPGGKGANQAVAASRLGGDVRFVTKIGSDVFGRQALDGFEREGLDVDFITKSENIPSGVALITVSEKGENTIVVASGANMDLKPADMPHGIFDQVGSVLIQLEIPTATIKYVIEKSHAMGIKVILNPAPASKLPDELFEKIYLITPNETETQTLTGILPDNEENLRMAAMKLRKSGVKNVIITLGEKGIYLLNENHDCIIPSPEVKAVDTTAAGDIFNGALATVLSMGKPWIEACSFACSAASVSVTRMGAQSSAPYLHEIG